MGERQSQTTINQVLVGRKSMMSCELTPKIKRKRVVMKKLHLVPSVYRTGLLSVCASLMLAGCCCLPMETRYDDTVRKYSVGKDEKATVYSNQPAVNKYRVGQNDGATAQYRLGKNDNANTYSHSQGGNRYRVDQLDKATAHYSYRPGHRPDLQLADNSGAGYGQGTGDAPLHGDMPLVLDLTDILFEFDKAVIRNKFVPELDRWAEFFKKHPQVKAQIMGHADSTGPSDYNQDLSERRAQAVVNYLVSRGVERSRLTAVGFGESMPVAPNTDPTGRQKNRGVEMKY